MMIAHAQEYARLGWPVLPIHPVCDGRCGCGRADCSSPGKHPIAALARNGLKDATTDPTTVGNWWLKAATANVGIATGPQAGIWVLDVDTEGLRVLPELVAAHGDLPLTPTAKTGSGGRHYFFRYVDGLTNSRGALPNGIDVRGAGGYVVAPPSNHVQGAYEWLPDLSPDETPVADAPAWLIEMILGGRPVRSEAPNGHADGHDRAIRLPGSGRSVAYGLAALRDEVARVCSAVPGQQEATLNEAGFNLGTLVGAGSLDYNDAMVALVGAGMQMVNQDGRPPWTLEQLRKKTEHGLTDGMKHPRNPTVPLLERIREAATWAPVAQVATNGHHLPPTDEPTKLTPMSMADLKAGYQTTRWLVGTPKAGLIPVGGTVVMAGEPGIGKTWMMLDLALSVATATPWLGHWPCEQGGVLLILEEEDPSTVWDRLTMLAGPRGLSVEQLMELPIKFFISAGIALVDREGNLNRALEQAITEFAPALVVMDPFRRLHGLEENDSGAMSHLFSLLRALTRVVDPALSIIIIHHLRKATENLREGLDRLRGSSDIAASVDGAFSVQGVFTQHLVLTHEKSKRGPACGTFRIHPEIGVAGVRLNYVLTVAAAADDDRKEVQEWILAELKLGGSSGRRLRTRAKVDGFTEHQIRKELLALEESGDIKQIPGNDGRSKLYVLTNAVPPVLLNAYDLEGDE
jgi:hypothetical protein